MVGFLSIQYLEKADFIGKVDVQLSKKLIILPFQLSK
jgi:hypothetical protein